MNQRCVRSASAPVTTGAKVMPRWRTRGFTLIELLVVVAIAALLTTLGAPSFRALIESVQLSSAANEFVASLRLARSEAIKRNARVALCKTPDGTVCTASGGWEQGWIVFHDPNNNGVREGTERILYRQVALASSLRLTGNATVAAYVAFVPTGGTKLVGGGFQAGTLTLCHRSVDAREGRAIILNAAGRPRVNRSMLENCF